MALAGVIFIFYFFRARKGFGEIGIVMFCHFGGIGHIYRVRLGLGHDISSHG